MSAQGHTDSARQNGFHWRRVPLAIVLATICLIGLGIRVTHWSAIMQTSWPQHPLAFDESDTHAFYEWAQAIRAGDWLGWNTYHPYFEWMKRIAPIETWYQWWGGKEVFHQAPLYPYLLSVILASCGGSLSCALLIQLLIGALHPIIMYVLAKRIFSPTAGLIAAGFTAVYGPYVFFEAVLLRDWLSPILEPLALVFALRAYQEERNRDWILAGGILGLALLTRETVLVLIPMVFAWTFYAFGKSFGRAFRKSGWLALGLVLCLLPLFGRNLVVGAPLFSLSTRSAESVIMANASGPRDASLPALLLRSGGDSLSAFRLSLQTGPQDWGHTLRLLRLKAQIITDVFELPNNVSLYYGRDISPILRWLLGYGLMFPLGLAGLLVLSRRSQDHRLCLAYGTATVIWLLAISAVSRYRLALIPFLTVYAAGLLVYLAESVRGRQWRPVAVRAAVCLAAAVMLQRFVLTLPASYRDFAYRPDYLAAARIYAERKEYDRAAAEIRTMIAKTEARPGHPPIPNFVLVDYALFQAHASLQRGKQEEARQALGQAVATFTEPVQESEAPMSYPLFNFGLLYLKLDEPEKARQALERFVELDPTNPLAERARNLLSRLDRRPTPSSGHEP